MNKTKEYLVNSGTFNIIVLPQRRRYYLLGTDEQSAGLMAKFVAGEQIEYDQLRPCWFKYAADESWHGFDGQERRIHADVSESDLIDYFVLKKFNFGSLVAVREVPHGKVQVFKRDKLAVSAPA
jgi:hypothetical protein